MTHTKKKSLSSNNKVIESAWDAYFKQAESITLESLRADGWLTSGDIAKKLNMTRAAAAEKMKKDSRITHQHFHIYVSGCTRKMVFFKVK